MRSRCSPFSAAGPRCRCSASKSGPGCAPQGQYSVVAAGGVILKRGHELAQVLKVFDKKLLKALSAKE